MAGFVLDCSVAISWLIADEKEVSNYSTLEEVAKKGAIVPSVWPLEVGNVLLFAERGKRMSTEQRHAAIYALNELPIKVDELTSVHAWHETMELAETCSLTLYDASYLELALRMNLPIMTFNKKLTYAAKQKGVIII